MNSLALATASRRLGIEPPPRVHRGDQVEHHAPSVVLLINILVALTLLAVGSSRRWIATFPRLVLVFAGLPVLNAALLAVYVFGEDSYRHDGTSRWDAYRSPGGALGPMFVLSVALMVAGAALLAYAALRTRTHLFRSTALSCGLGALLVVTPTIIGFSTN
jgi:hypothetical protein